MMAVKTLPASDVLGHGEAGTVSSQGVCTLAPVRCGRRVRSISSRAAVRQAGTLARLLVATGKATAGLAACSRARPVAQGMASWQVRE